jgi:enolase
MIIKEVKARAILDSRKQKTIEVSVNGCVASSPSGKSTGKYETPCYFKSLENNIKLINNSKLLIGLEINSFSDLKKIEALIKKKFRFNDAKKFGANALYAWESAILKALAKSEGKELWQIINPDAKVMPIPVGNAIGGGLHSHNEGHPIFQEFLLIPKEVSIQKNVAIMNDIYNRLKVITESKSVDDEGALQVGLHDEQVLHIMAHYKDKVNIGIDCASSTIFEGGFYRYNKLLFSNNMQIKYINHLIDTFDIFYIEDPIDEEDFLGFERINRKHLLVGDDLTVTHKDRLKKAIKNKSINAMIIKPNQNGSLVELAEIFKICKKNRIKTILSHRAGETMDSALADYAFAFEADYIKCGIKTKWREAKLNRLIEIEKSFKHTLF